MHNERLMFIANVDWFFVSHRLPIALQALKEGYEVHVACGVTDFKCELEGLGLHVHPLAISRGKAGFLNNAGTFLEICAILHKIRPDIVHLVTIKPVIFGGLAVRILGIKSMVAAVSGLGFVFVDRGFIASVRRVIIGLLYRLALGKENLRVIFQNPDDRESLCRLAGIKYDNTELIRGSGVDLSKFKPNSFTEGVPIVILAARLLKDKGVLEFVAASRLLIARGYQARFCLVGDIDPENPASLTKEQMENIAAEGCIEHWGFRPDMAEVLKSANIVVLPSYREGLPKVLLEAAAAGRVVVTTDVPGCRDAIEHGTTGLLVPPRDPLALAETIGGLLDDRGRCIAMGAAGRELAEREFDVSLVVQRHMEIYKKLGALAL